MIKVSDQTCAFVPGISGSRVSLSRKLRKIGAVIRSFLSQTKGRAELAEIRNVNKYHEKQPGLRRWFLGKSMLL